MRERGVQVVANEIDRGEQLGQSFQGVVLALQRDEHRIGGGEGVHGQQPERRRAIDEDVVVAVGDVGDQAGEAPFPGLDRREFDLGSGERDRRRDQVDPSGPSTIRRSSARSSMTAS